MKFDFSAIWPSLRKTAVVAATGLLVPTALAITSGTPTGGFATYLNAHPTTGLVFGLAAMLAHNYLSQIQTVPLTQVVAPVTSVVPVTLTHMTPVTAAPVASTEGPKV